MIDARDFRMVELLTHADLEAHPLWADFHEERDRTRILGWGVAVERLDREIERYDYCGRSPLYPVIDLAAADDVASPSVALEFVLPDGRTLPGYVVAQQAFGLFVGDEEYCINPSLPSRATQELARLAEALSLDAADLAALAYASPFELGARGRIEGVLQVG